MTDKNSITRKFQVPCDDKEQMRQTLRDVFDALNEKGYNPINQLCGYFVSADPTYITNHNNARALITQVEREDILEVITEEYIEKI